MLRFTYDRSKSLSNRLKHGIDFIGAQALWLDARRLEIPLDFPDGPRRLIVGMIEDKHYSAVVTYRGDATRIISVRRSRKKEVALYESNRVR
jgi:uncharacterized DUF497 family protein